jgi:hypothetical protein
MLYVGTGGRQLLDPSIKTRKLVAINQDALALQELNANVEAEGISRRFTWRIKGNPCSKLLLVYSVSLQAFALSTDGHARAGLAHGMVIRLPFSTGHQHDDETMQGEGP